MDDRDKGRAGRDEERLASLVREYGAAGRAAVWAGLAAAAALMLVVGLTVIGPRGGGMSAEEAARLRDEIARLEAEAARAMAAVELLELRERHARVEARLAEVLRRPDPDRWVQAETERAAATLVAGGDRMVRELNLTESGAALYRRAIELFPETPGAEIARQRLARL